MNSLPNPKQPFSRAEDHEQFCYKDGDRFCGLSRVVQGISTFTTDYLHDSTTLDMLHSHSMYVYPSG